MLSESAFKRNVQRLIMPLVAGTKLTGCRKKCALHVTPEAPATLHITLRPGQDSAYGLLLSRPQAFTPAETHLVHAILDKWSRAFSAPCAEPLVDVIAEQGKLEALAEFIDPACSKLLLTLFDAMADWAGQTYEGRPISLTVGVDGKAELPAATTAIQDILEEDFLKVMASSQDTILVCAPDGRIVRHEALYELDGPTLDELDGENYDYYAPITYIPVARWTTEGRYAVTLSREGEILVFKDASLLFARRRGKWLFFTHTAYIDGMGARRHERKKRKALYQTMLDVSFNRTGGCLALWRSGHAAADGPVTDGDRLDRPDNAACGNKTLFLRALIKGRKFHELPRKLRQEMVAMDGATILLRDGAILAVGAILRIGGGSPGGGRLAAAMELAKNGVGVKISNDGKISYWVDLPKRAPAGKPPPPKYEIG